MDEATKERLIGELREHLDAVAHSPLDEPEAQREVDLYSLLTELAGLRNEVRLESRQLKGALDDFRAVFTTLDASSEHLQRELDARREDETAARAATERPLLLELIALRDRLEQARALAAGLQPGPLARLAARREHALVHDLGEGLAITVRRLDQSLVAYGVTAVKAVGQPLDPHTMRASAVRSEPDQPDGVVLEEVYRGYLRAGEVLRLAEVVANKRARET